MNAVCLSVRPPVTDGESFFADGRDMAFHLRKKDAKYLVLDHPRNSITRIRPLRGKDIPDIFAHYIVSLRR
jgi:hypothetical protein